MSAETPFCVRGFTLIEVLIALAIVGLGLIAVFGQINQSALAAARLRDKTLAHWIAMNLLTEKRLGGAFPGDGTESDVIEMANTRWRYEIRFSETALENLRRADVSVALADSPERPLSVASGFYMETPGGAGLPSPATGWPSTGAQSALGSNVADPPSPTTAPDSAPEAAPK